RQIAHVRLEAVLSARMSTCLLETANDHFSSECSEMGRRPLLFLWGDSLASSLYPGLKALQASTNFGIAQYNIAGCPPIPSFAVAGRPNCVNNNNLAIAAIAKEKPEIVVLELFWLYSGLTPDDLAKTARVLHELGVPRIVLVGPLPMWPGGGLPDTFLPYYRHNRPPGLLPARLRLPHRLPA